MAKKKSTILVTGAKGFVGSHVVRSLNRRKIRPRVFVRPGGNRINLDGADIEIVEGDLTDRQAVQKALEGIKKVVHVAGYVSSRPSQRQNLMKCNFTATTTLFDAAGEAGIERIVHLGSVTGLGASEKPETWQEGTPYNLAHLKAGYFESKRAAEQAVEERVKAGMPVVGLYPTYCLGPDDVYLSSSRLVTEFVKGNLPFVTEGGMGFVDVRDVAEAMVVGLDKGEIGQKYFLGGHNLTFRQFYEVIAKVSGKSVPKTVLPHWLLYTLCVLAEPLTDGAILSRSVYGLMSLYWWYDNNKAERDLGWTFRPLEETITDAIGWLKQKGHL